MAPELQFKGAGGANHMRIIIALRLLLLAILTCTVVLIMLPAMILGGSKFLREVYAVLENEYNRLRGSKKAAR